MYYAYILLSQKSHIFYFGSTNNLKSRLILHNSGKIKSTKAHIPWKLVWYGGFETEKEAYELEVKLQEALKQAQEATERARRLETTLDTLRSRIEALVEMKPTDLMQNINLVVRTLKEVLEALTQLSPN